MFMNLDNFISGVVSHKLAKTGPNGMASLKARIEMNLMNIQVFTEAQREDFPLLLLIGLLKSEEAK